MELNWLEDFLALAECGNFSRAAQRRNLTQPAFSRRIRALEDWTGTPLFDRSTQPVGLTEAGRRFRPFADETMRRLLQGREEARLAGGAAATALRFAATHALSLTFFPNWLRRLEGQARLGAVHLLSDCEETNGLTRWDGGIWWDFRGCGGMKAAEIQGGRANWRPARQINVRTGKEARAPHGLTWRSPPRPA